MMNAETVWRRQQWKAKHDDAELRSSLWPDHVYPHSSSSDEPKSDLRLVVLGGDCADNNYASNIILRCAHQETAINPRKGSFREGTVDGRQVCVFVAPSYWMNHLASYTIFSRGVESIKDELQNCTFLTFPGPHAFLLVMRTGHITGKERYLLKAIKCMFGAEALQYTATLFVHGHEWESPINALQSCCVKMCRENYFFLENSDESVERLFRRLVLMTRRRKSRFFIQQSYEGLMKMAFERWESARVRKEMKRNHDVEEVKTRLRSREEEIDALRQAERDLRKELDESRHRESVLQKALGAAMFRQKQLRAEMEAFEENEAGARKSTRSNSFNVIPPLMTETQSSNPLDDL